MAGHRVCAAEVEPDPRRRTQLGYEGARRAARRGLMRNGELGFWWRSLGGVPDPRPPLDGPFEADYLKSGQLEVALNDAQAARLRAGLALALESGLGEHDLLALEAGELRTRVRVSGARLATFTPHVARVHPAKLLAGLCSAVE